MSKNENGLAIDVASYQTAVSLWTNEGSGLWSKFAGFITVHSIFLLAAVQLLVAHDTDCRLRVFLVTVFCVAGMLTAAANWFILFRSFRYQNYYIGRAKAIETSLMKPSGFVSNMRATEFRKPLGLSIEKLMYLTLVFFLAVYIAVLFASWYELLWL